MVYEKTSKLLRSCVFANTFSNIKFEACFLQFTIVPLVTSTVIGTYLFVLKWLNDKHTTVRSFLV